jgi:hypothetical protein
MSSGEIRKRIGFELGTFDAIDVDEVSDLKDLERIIELKESRN